VALIYEERIILDNVTHLGVTIDGVWIGELDLLTTCTHHAELEVITALSLISTLYKSLHATSSHFSFTNRFLVTDLNNDDSSASLLTLLLAGEYLATELLSAVNSTIAPSLLSLPCRVDSTVNP
jgi:hypothetical protein